MSAPLSADDLRSLVVRVESAVARGADHARRIQAHPVIRAKSSLADLVTDADTAVEEILREELGALLPDAVFVGEESADGLAHGAAPGELSWVVDPIDGTTNFIYGLPYAVCVALVLDGRPLLGVVADVTEGAVYSAVAGAGRALVRRGDLDPLPVTPRAIGAGLGEAVIATGFPYDRERAPAMFGVAQEIHRRGRDLRRIGACSLDIVYTGLGRLDGYVELVLRLWDVAAAQVIAQELGVAVTGWRGEPLEFRDPGAAISVVAAREPLHRELLELIRSAM